MKRSTIIDQLRKAISESDESQAAIAEATGIAQPHLNRFINGARGISFENAAVLCDYLKLELVSKKR